MTEKELIDFENEIADLFNQGLIRAPVHLRGGNEKEVLEISRNFRSQDWFCGTWASHLWCLAKGVPQEELKKAILNKQSITLCFNKYKIICSAIVGGIAPIATGIALGIKQKKLDEHIYCAIGDMSFWVGSVQESIRYSLNHKLPITFIVEDNGLSVKTPTEEVWKTQPNDIADTIVKLGYNNVIYYRYKNTWGHSGTGKRVIFW